MSCLLHFFFYFGEKCTDQSSVAVYGDFHTKEEFKNERKMYSDLPVRGWPMMNTGPMGGCGPKMETSVCVGWGVLGGC